MTRETPEEVRDSLKEMVGELDNFEIPIEVQINILMGKIQGWKNTVYDAKKDAQVALVIDDNRLMQAAKLRLERAFKSIEFFEGELDILNKSQSGDAGE